MIADHCPQLRLDESRCETGPVKMITLAGLPMLAILTWLVALMIDPGQFAGPSIILLGVGWMIMASVATVGMVLAGGRWAVRTLLAVTATGLYAGLFRPVDAASIAASVITAAALISLLSPQLGRQIRKLPSASGPPPAAVAATLIPLSMPLSLGLGPTPANGWVVTGAFLGPLAALLYSKTINGGLFALRFGFPLIVAALAIPMGIPHGVIAVLVGALGTGVAWQKEVATAFHPLIERGSAYSIPPELTPTEILEQARIDESGNRL